MASLNILMIGLIISLAGSAVIEGVRKGSRGKPISIQLPLPFPDPPDEPEPEPEPKPAPKPRPISIDVFEYRYRQYLYHYALMTAIVQIVREMRLKPSLGSGGNAAYGEGHYFTDLSFLDAYKGSMFQLARALFTNPFHWGGNRVNIGYIEVLPSYLLILRVAHVHSRTYGTRWIYLHPSRRDLPLGGILTGSGKVSFSR
jgi:hypothetical protein